MIKQSHLARTALLLLLCLALVACQTSPRGGFDEGHAWIMPRPAAEVHLSVVDTDGVPVPNPILWAYRGEEKYTSDGGFVGYDPLAGLVGDGSGDVVAQYVGEIGGGYEVPMNAPTPPQHRLVIEAPGYTPASINLDDLLFLQKHRTGKTAVVVGGATIEMVVVAYRVALEKE